MVLLGTCLNNRWQSDSWVFELLLPVGSLSHSLSTRLIPLWGFDVCEIGVALHLLPFQGFGLYGATTNESSNKV